MNAGWYKDKQDPSMARYWDGEQWTEKTRSIPTQPVPASTVQPTPSPPPAVPPTVAPAFLADPAAQQQPPAQPAPVVAAPPPPPSQPRYSDDGRFYWDGGRWVPVPAQPLAQPQYYGAPAVRTSAPADPVTWIIAAINIFPGIAILVLPFVLAIDRGNLRKKNLVTSKQLESPLIWFFATFLLLWIVVPVYQYKRAKALGQSMNPFIVTIVTEIIGLFLWLSLFGQSSY